MLAVLLKDKNDCAVQTVEPPRDLQQDEILVQMEYSSVQPFDSHMLTGQIEISTPHIMGIEGVGSVTQSQCSDFPEGTRVSFIFNKYTEDFGCWCTSVVLSQKRACIATVPRDLAPQEAAAGITSSLTALACLRHFTKGSVIVVTGACGAVGLALTQLALLRGISVIALVRGSSRVSWLMQEVGPLGTLSAVDVTTSDWWKLAAMLCDAGDAGEASGADGVIDGVGGVLLPQSAEHLVRIRGKLITYGAVSGQPDKTVMDTVIQNRALQVIHEGANCFLRSKDAVKQFQALLELMKAGKYRPRPWELVHWHKAPNCLVPQTAWSGFVSQYTEGRIGRIIIKFD